MFAAQPSLEGAKIQTFIPCPWRTALLAACLLAAAPAWADGHAAPTGLGHGTAFSPPQSTLPPAKQLTRAASGHIKPYGGTPVDVTTFHYDNNRTGWNATETDLTPASVASSKFGLLATLPVDGSVFAEPLIVSNFVLPDGTTHDIVIVVTAHDSVYAFDEQSFATLWQVSLGTSQTWQDVGCYDVVPEYGISSTPVILRTATGTATIYVVAATEPTSKQFVTQLHALNLGTGADVTPPVTIAPSAKLPSGPTVAFNPQHEWNRTGLASFDGNIYFGIGSNCDSLANTDSGWLVGYNADLTPLGAFHTINRPATMELASIWMSGFAPAINGYGDVFVATGNGNAGPYSNDWGQSVLRLTPTLSKVTSYLTEADYKNLNKFDLDLGSGGVMLLPRQPGQTGANLAVAMGKDAQLFLMNQAELGGDYPHDDKVLQVQSVAPSGHGLWGGPAFYAGPDGPTVFVQVHQDVLRAFTLTTGAKPTLTAGVTGTSTAGFGGSMPIVSSNGATPGTGVVWLVRRSSPLELEAYDAVSLGAPIFASQAGSWPKGNAFVTPLEANGRVYVPADQTVEVFGLTQ